MTALALLFGYVLGSIPTASFLGRLGGVDLRREGSRNPGTNNALRTSGPLLAVTVLAVEAAKGYGAVAGGAWLGDDLGAIAGGLGAVAGNVYNVWYRFQGGKGLGISLGVLAASWPTVLVLVVAVIALAVLVTRSSGIASLATLAALVVASFIWTGFEFPTGGVEPTGQLIALSVGISLIVFQKHWQDTPFSAHARR